MRKLRLLFVLGGPLVICACAYAQDGYTHEGNGDDWSLQDPIMQSQNTQNANALPVGVPESVSGSGGTLYAPKTLGQAITVSGVQLAGGFTASVTCPVTFFGAGTYQWNWTCENGTIVVNGTTVATVQGKMILTCSGGGRGGHPTTCWHIFSGFAGDNDAGLGAVTVAAKGGPNNAPGTVQAFSASW